MRRFWAEALWYFPSILSIDRISSHRTNLTEILLKVISRSPGIKLHTKIFEVWNPKCTLPYKFRILKVLFIVTI
jgi:hypothetical protein